MVCVLLVAAGAAWESTVLGELDGQRDMVVLKRCMDVEDLLAAASAGQADVAVVAVDAPGLDLAAVEHLRRHRVRPVAVTPEGVGAHHEAIADRARRIGVRTLLTEGELARLPEVLRSEEPSPGAVGLREPVGGDGADLRGELVEDGVPGTRGRVLAVWGPAGAPGRSTVAAGVAAELAARQVRTVLVDADPWAGTLAQQLGVLEESSGVLAAARLCAGGDLDTGFARTQRALDEYLTLVTGLPRADRWVEVRSGAVEQLLEVAAAAGEVVVDVGFSLEDDPASEFGARPGRNTMTLDGLGAADQILVVGAADPVGLSRLARGLVELRELGVPAPVRVVVNRMRPSLGWTEQDIVGMVEGFARVDGVHFLPEDRAGVDRALVAGRTLAETGDSVLSRALGPLVDEAFPDAPRAAGRRRRISSRRAGRVRRR